MKISYFHYLSNYLYGKSAASVHVLELVDAWRRLGHEITVLRHGRLENGRALEVSVRTKPHARWLSQWLHEPRNLLENMAFFSERRWLVQARPDCVVVRYAFGRASGGLAAQRLGIPWILQIDAAYELESPHLSYYRRLPAICPAIEKWLVRSCNAMVTVARETYEYYQKQGVPQDKMIFAPNGVDTDRFRPDVDGSEIRRRFGLDGHLVLGFVGGFYPWHGLEGLVSLAKGLLPRHSELKMLLVGDGPERQRIEEIVRHEKLEDRVIFTGSVERTEVPKYHASIDIALAPAPKMENYYYSPMKLFEYLASGRAVVAADRGQMGEIIRDGENGLLYEPGDWMGLMRQVERFLGDEKLRERCGERARETVLERHTWKKAAERIQSLLEKVVKGSAAPAREI